MRAEKIVLSFVFVLIGLLVAGGAFYFYQSTKVISPGSLKTIKLGVSPSPSKSSLYLKIETPQDESTTNNKTVTISGQTSPTATIIINTPTSDQVIPPSATGNFSTTVTIGDDENRIYVTAVGTQGEEVQKILTVTYTTETF